MAIKDRPRLGKGLKSLISTQSVVTVKVPEASANTPLSELPAGEALAQLPIGLIDPNPYQPRENVDPISLRELAASIEVSGLLQPIVVKPVGDRYQLIAGHRRTEAARLAGFPTISAIVRGGTERDQAELALIENIQRSDLNPIERARAYRKLTEHFSLTHAELAEKLGEDRTTITNFLRLLELNPGVQDLVARGLLSAGHAKVLAGLADPALQDTYANRCVAEGLSVRKLEELIALPPSANTQTVDVASHARTLVAKSAHIVEVEEELSRKLGTRVRILPAAKKNTGKLVIQYFSLDEFDRIVEKFS